MMYQVKVMKYIFQMKLILKHKLKFNKIKIKNKKTRITFLKT